jgi:AcrR family transcriptional regulator
VIDMAKAFNENEIEAIRQKLIESCRICWERYGYRKTSVAQLCEMSGISTGAFYAFYPTKEMLFIATANAFQEKLYTLLRDSKPENPSKQDLANSFKMMLEELAHNKWVFSLREDYQVFLPKLPSDFLEQDQQKDMLDISEIIEFYGLVPRVSMEEITAVVYTLYMSLYFTDIVGKHHTTAVGLLLDSVMDKLFE